MKAEISNRRSNIVRIESYINKENDNYVLVENKGFLNIFFSSGIYSVDAFGFKKWFPEKEDVPKNNILIDNKIYYKPHIVLTLGNGKKETIYYDTEEEMLIERERMKEQEDSNWVTHQP